MSLPRFAATTPNAGVTRRVPAEIPELMVVSFHFETGDSLVIQGGVEHGCRCIESRELIDNFTPCRDDFPLVSNGS